jgi:ribulose-phosphate 3-epimerase
MSPVIPTIFAKNKRQFEQRFNKLIDISNELQIDIMDGTFVKSKSLLISEIPFLKKYDVSFEAHLMVENPIIYLQSLKKRGFEKIIFHCESTSVISEVLHECLMLSLKPILAINPETPLKEIAPLLPKLKQVLVMGVVPGRENQEIVPATYDKIKALRKLKRSLIIQVDGGVNEKTIKKLAKAGANIVNSGSYICNSEDPAEALKKLNSLFK